MRDVSPEYKRPIDTRICSPAIWLDETAHDERSAMEKAIELVKSNDSIGAIALLESKKHYWAGIRDGNRFMKNPFTG